MSKSKKLATSSPLHGHENGLTEFEQAYLEQWSEIHKRSALVYLILRALRTTPMWSGQLVEYIDQATNNSWGVDERSLYRALRRLNKMELVQPKEVQASGTGAKRKIFSITNSGNKIFEAYEQTTMAYISSP